MPVDEVARVGAQRHEVFWVKLARLVDVIGQDMMHLKIAISPAGDAARLALKMLASNPRPRTGAAE